MCGRWNIIQKSNVLYPGQYYMLAVALEWEGKVLSNKWITIEHK